MSQKTKQTKWNTDVVDGLSVEYGFKVVKHTEYHFSLYHPQRGRMDYWPSTGKYGWFHNNKIYGNLTVIPDIEAYLMKHFNPNHSVSTVNTQDRIERLELALRRIIKLPTTAYDACEMQNIAKKALDQSVNY